MKFVHLADAHLDSPFLGLSFLPSAQKQTILQAANQSLAKIIHLALEQEADLVLIAGDTFNSTHPSPASQLFFAKQVKLLTDAKIQTVMVFGNHDHLDPADLLVQPSPYFHLLGAGQKIQQLHLTTSAGFHYSVAGFSYLQNHIPTDLVAQLPVKTGQEFAFGLFHAGEAMGHQQADVYAPFTKDDLRKLNYDYFALGHIHHRQIVLAHPLAVYPGNIQGRQSNELGAKGCYLGTIDEQSRAVGLQFVSTSQPVWQEVRIKLSGTVSKQVLTKTLTTKINESLQGQTCVCLIVDNSQYLSDSEVELLQDTDYWQTLSEELLDDSCLVKVSLAAKDQLLLNAQDRPAFIRAEQETLTAAVLEKAGRDLGKKSAVFASQLKDPQFQQEIFTLAHSKLQRYLRGLADETTTD
jgi:DNA repair exonuclease SbcCD nuclease subunit